MAKWGRMMLGTIVTPAVVALVGLFLLLAVAAVGCAAYMVHTMLATMTSKRRSRFLALPTSTGRQVMGAVTYAPPSVVGHRWPVYDLDRVGEDDD